MNKGTDILYSKFKILSQVYFMYITTIKKI